MIKLKANKRMSESLALALFLTLAGGVQDAYSYNCRGKVFANAQTGNIVLLGQNLAQGNFQTAMHYVMSLAAFLAGVYITEWMRHLFKGYERIHWRQIVLLFEVVLLVIVGFLPNTLDVLANVLMSFACAMQVNSFRKFNGVSFATTMCIGNMRSATELLCRYHITKDKTLRNDSFHYYGAILVFAIGAAIGAVVSIQVGLQAIWIAAVLLLAGFMLIYINGEG